MKQITFKNGKSLKVTQEIADVLRDRIVNNVINAVNNFQAFSEGGKTICMVNISEIAFIGDPDLIK